MIRGLYISATQLSANEKLLDAIGNNLANVDATGFKRDELQQESFNDILLTKYNGSNVTYATANKGVKVTKDADKDYTLEASNGYFRIQTDTGISYNKLLKLSVDKDGYLSTYYYNSDKKKDANLGDKVIGANGPIQVGTQDFSINEKGEVLVGGQAVDSLVYTPSGDVIGTMGSGIKSTRLVTDFSAGNIIPTENPLDVALQGDGFIELSTPYGTKYSRNGSFSLNTKMELITADGYKVQGFKGDIVLKSDKVTINEFGEIIEDGAVIDKLKVVNFSDKGDLRKVGGTLYDFSSTPQGEQIGFEGKVLQGRLEQSNVNAITEMIRMITVQKDYENGQKLIRAFDETLTKAATDLGTVR